MRAGSRSALALVGPSAGRAADRTSRTVPSGMCNCSGGKPSRGRGRRAPGAAADETLGRPV